MHALLTATLTSHLIDEPRPIGAALWRKLREQIRSGDAITLARWVQDRLHGDEQTAVLRRLDLLDAMRHALEPLQAKGVEVVTEFDSDYPRRFLERLGGKHPAMLFVAGQRTLLNADTIGIVGSRDVDDDARDFARAVAAEAVAHGQAVVSGGARGVDAEAMLAALDEGGAALGFLADSLLKAAGQMREGRVCLATLYSPNAAFQVGNAMARNKLIYAHSRATVVVSSAAETGGTWAGAKEALEKKLCTVLVRLGATVPDGNVQLVRCGGIGIGQAAEVWSHLQPHAGPVQATLF